MAGVVAAIVLLSSRMPWAQWSETGQSALEGGLFLVVMAPVVILLERRNGFLVRLREGRQAL